MSPEIYTVIAAAIALAGLILNGQRFTANSIAELRKDLNALGQRVSRVEGLLEGIRDSIRDRAA